MPRRTLPHLAVKVSSEQFIPEITSVLLLQDLPFTAVP